MTAAQSTFCYEKYTGQEKEVRLPETAEGLPLSAIGAKAFLSCKSVERLVLPSTLETVGDWAFAHMKNLREVVLPAKEITFGKKVFLGCEKLQRILFCDRKYDNISGNRIYEGIPLFLASAFCFFAEETLQSLQSADLIQEDLLSTHSNDVLLNLQMAGDCHGQWKWLFLYDQSLKAFLLRNDDDGFVPAFIGWFHVEDVDDQRQDYIRKIRGEKLRLVFQRLSYPEHLEKDMRHFFHAYLKENSSFVAELFSQSPEFGRDIRYYKIWHASGGLTSIHAEQFLAKLPETEPEIRSYLLECQLENKMDNEGFFTELEL
ncbi:MAG: leucine-rich repeat domain-containing protein [Lachnoclostridium sp.]|nr:leucine-rich repeat domain-containing protein [Lachnospira sp.]MCM1248999.1 leucine-rich repeat domain-containing protein [Lachnoclostridium sp.]